MKLITIAAVAASLFASSALAQESSTTSETWGPGALENRSSVVVPPCCAMPTTNSMTLAQLRMHGVDVAIRIMDGDITEATCNDLRTTASRERVMSMVTTGYLMAAYRGNYYASLAMSNEMGESMQFHSAIRGVLAACTARFSDVPY